MEQRSITCFVSSAYMTNITTDGFYDGWVNSGIIRLKINMSCAHSNY